jgi:hypothetical protein
LIWTCELQEWVHKALFRILSSLWRVVVLNCWWLEMWWLVW